jgi:hypothetical protein
MHSPLAQVASFGPQVINGNGVGLSSSITLQKEHNFLQTVKLQELDVILSDACKRN